eukprot:m.1681726 g.1681726  ORF g.1681726 m.1681726 type:complete len:60 (-) comp228873_c0_seq1:38-217(-)
MEQRVEESIIHYSYEHFSVIATTKMLGGIHGVWEIVPDATFSTAFKQGGGANIDAFHDK